MVNTTTISLKTYLGDQLSLQNIQTASGIIYRTPGITSTHGRSINRDEGERQTATPLQIALQGVQIIAGNASGGKQTVVQEFGLVLHRTRPVED